MRVDPEPAEQWVAVGVRYADAPTGVEVYVAGPGASSADDPNAAYFRGVVGRPGPVRGPTYWPP